MQSRNARLGHLLFVIYTILYGAYVLLNAFSPETMEKTPLLGLNLAILSGFGLIAAAFLFAMLYGVLCTADGDIEPNDVDHNRAEANVNEPRDQQGQR